MARFANQTVMITGGARGQGLSHALAFAEEGANVVLCDAVAAVDSVPYALSDQADLDNARTLVEKTGSSCLAMTADVRRPEQLRAVVDAARDRFGGVDVLCANAGILSYSEVVDMPTQMWQDMIDINLTGVFNSVQAVLPVMKAADSGRIIATASMAARGGFGNIAHYVAAKWGIIGLIKSVAVELGASSITANVVAPTNVDSDMIQNPPVWRLFAPGVASPTREDAAPACAAMSTQDVPWIPPGDVTHAVLFLADPMSRYITGEVLHVSAGAAAHNSA